MKKLIAFTGYARTGKDTSCSILQSYYRAQHLAFAEKLKTEVRRALMLTPESFASCDKELIRPLFQSWGDFKRSLDPHYYTRSLKEKFNASSYKMGIITDLRFPEEVDLVKEYGGLIVRVHRAGVGPANNHFSETYLNTITPDYHLQNHGDLDQLRRSVFQLLEDIRAGGYLS